MRVYKIVSSWGNNGQYNPAHWLEIEGAEDIISPRFTRIEGLFLWLGDNGFTEIAGTLARKYTKV